MENFNKLTPAETERLSLLAEECAEVIQAIGKIMRHGYDSGNPKNGTINRVELNTEICDVLTIVEMLYTAKDIDDSVVENNIKLKKEKMKKFLHHN